jgi:hypothetical protein
MRASQTGRASGGKMARLKSGAELRREQVRANFFSKDDLWTGDKETGWFPALRTLPLILSLIDSKPISGTKSASLVYFELLSRHRSDGVIEMSNEADHAFAAGYEGSRAVRSWQERMKTLEKNGFIRVQKVGNERYKYVAIVHPTTAVENLRKDKKVPDSWWDAYFARKLETKESTYDQRLQKQAAAKVVPFPPFATPVTPFPVPAPPVTTSA